MVTVTRKFRDNFETWAAHKVASGDWTPEDMAAFRDLLRQDLTPGPDLLRQALTVLVDGEAVSAQIDDVQERYRLWAEFFEAELRTDLKTSGGDQV